MHHACTTIYVYEIFLVPSPLAAAPENLVISDLRYTFTTEANEMQRIALEYNFI